MARKKVSADFDFPNRLSELMEEQKLKQQDLADELGIKRQTVSLYMNGQSMPDALQVRNIAAFFGVSSDWLLGLTDVKAQDLDIREVCEYTGLSETAVDSLHHFIADKDKNGVYPAGFTDAKYTPRDFINDLLSHRFLFHIIVEFCDGVNNLGEPDVDSSTLISIQKNIDCEYRDHNILTLSLKEISSLQIAHAKSNIASLIDSFISDYYNTQIPRD